MLCIHIIKSLTHLCWSKSISREVSCVLVPRGQRALVQLVRVPRAKHAFNCIESLVIDVLSFDSLPRLRSPFDQRQNAPWAKNSLVRRQRVPRAQHPLLQRRVHCVLDTLSFDDNLLSITTTCTTPEHPLAMEKYLPTASPEQVHKMCCTRSGMFAIASFRLISARIGKMCTAPTSP